MMSEEEQDSSGGVVFCSAEFAEKLDDFSDLFKKHRQPMAEAERFAMAIGIVKNSRLPKDEWKEGKKKRKGTQGLSTFEEGGRYNFRILFEMLDLWNEDDDVSLTLTISTIDRIVQTKAVFSKKRQCRQFLLFPLFHFCSFRPNNRELPFCILPRRDSHRL